jgi:hypothetical protein
LEYPTSVEAVSTEMTTDTYPVASMVRYEFPARGERPAVKVTWYDGGLLPFKPDELEEGRQLPWEDGIVFVGEKGKLVAEGWGAQSVRLIPEKRMQEYKKPSKTLPRSIGHYKEWVQACKEGTPTGSNFDFARLVTETCLLGNIAIRTGKKRSMGEALIREKLVWDGPNMKFTNVPEANEYVQKQYRQGWTL